MQKTNRTEELIKFCKQYSPSYQLEICGNPEECFFGDYPTLAHLKAEFGKNAAMAFIIPQLQNLATYCGSKEKLDENQYTECAFIISTEFYFLKVSEIMLFCHRFKTGRYGRFYGSIDPLIITGSLRKFIEERYAAIDYYERHKNDDNPERLARLKHIEEYYEELKNNNRK